MCFVQGANATTFVARPASDPTSATAGPVAPSGVIASNGISCDGGPIINDGPGVNAYFIWYGNWSSNQDAQRIRVKFITHVGSSSYFNINTTYYSQRARAGGDERGKDFVLNRVRYKRSASDEYSHGVNLTHYSVYLVVWDAISEGQLPADPNAVYFVLTSPDMNETGFGIRNCGWHSSSVSSGLPTVSGVDIKYAFVGDAEAQFAYSCIWNYPTTMSGSLGADGMANIIAHELSESVTDPDGTSWVNPGGQEVADLCAWTFGAAYHSGSAGDPYPPNLVLEGTPHLIQEI